MIAVTIELDLAATMGIGCA